MASRPMATRHERTFRNLSITANDLFPIVGNMVAGRGERFYLFNHFTAALLNRANRGGFCDSAHPRPSTAVCDTSHCTILTRFFRYTAACTAACRNLICLNQPPVWASFVRSTGWLSSGVRLASDCSLPPGSFACWYFPRPSARRLVPWWCSLLAKSVCSIVRTMSTRQMQICLIKRTFFDIKKSRREKRRDTGQPPARESTVENDLIDRLGVRVGTGVKWNPATRRAVRTQ